MERYYKLDELWETFDMAIKVDANNKDEAYKVEKLFQEKIEKKNAEETKKQELINQMVFAGNAIAIMAIIPSWEIGGSSIINLIFAPLVGALGGALMGIPYISFSISKLAQRYNEKYTELKVWGISLIGMMCMLAIRWWLIP